MPVIGRAKIVHLWLLLPCQLSRTLVLGILCIFFILSSQFVVSWSRSEWQSKEDAEGEAGAKPRAGAGEGAQPVAGEGEGAGADPRAGEGAGAEQQE